MSYWDYTDAEFEDLKGKVLKSVRKQDGQEGEEIRFVTDDGAEYIQYHYSSCCEDVHVDDIAGDLDDLIDTPILLAEKVTNSDEHPEGKTPEWEPESFTWTFYKLSTIKGSVTIRWFGTSNGYYSEEVSFRKAN